MMTDRELIEAAAKAGGLLSKSWYGNSAYLDGLISRWNPLESNSDAFHLMVSLNLTIKHTHPVVHVEDRTGGVMVEEEHRHDKYVATRRAIVRVAAQIEKMTPHD